MSTMSRRSCFPWHLAAAAAITGCLLGTTNLSAQQCGNWSPLGGLDIEAGVRGFVTSIAVFDDGGGEAVYIGGNFLAAPPGRPGIKNLAKWNGQEWLPVVSAPPAWVTAMVVHDDGTGPALYVATNLDSTLPAPQRLIRRWDGSTWSSVGGGLTGSFYSIRDMRIIDLGDGPKLYVAGQFTVLPGAFTNAACWDGQAWTALGNALPTPADFRAIESVGGELYAGGNQVSLRRFDGAQWVPVPEVGGNNIRALLTWDNGAGPTMYIAGSTSSSGTGRYNGVAYEPIAGPSAGGIVRFAVFEDGAGPRLYGIAPGTFSNPGKLALLGPAGWSAVAQGISVGGFEPTLEAIAATNIGGVSRLLVGGKFKTLGGAQSESIAAYDGAGWQAMAPGVAPSVSALAQFGGELYAGGTFARAGGAEVNNMARWDGFEMNAVGAGLTGSANTMLVFDDGSGEALYVAGSFAQAGGQQANSIARWTGTQWQQLGGGVTQSNGAPGTVNALALHDDGGGVALFAGGSFARAGGIAVSNIARWRDGGWSTVEGGINGGAYSLLSYDDGSGPALYVGGVFNSANGVPVWSIARRRGATWEDVGGGVSGFGSTAFVTTMLPFDDGGGAGLYVAGNFQTAGGVPALMTARWRSGAWSALTPSYGGVFGTLSFRGMAALNNTSTPSLFIAGPSFQIATQTGSYEYLVGWTGTNWFSPGSGVNAGALAMLAIDDPANPRLIVGGEFSDAGGVVSPGLAVWNACQKCYANCDGSSIPPVLNVNDFVCFQQRFAAGDPYANCDGSTNPPVLNVNDFVCFQQRFAAGCP